MLPIAAPQTPLAGGQLAAIAAFSVFALGYGVAHYRGWHRGWMRWLPSEASFFTPLWFGATGLLLVLAELARRASTWLGVVFAVPLLIAAAITVMSLVWLPSTLLPDWYLDWRQRRRPPWERRA
ncbi:MAG TPA: hypothetical protein VMD09_12190 [Solirubrobacteraceae bacterium]|nr:hypothetical protein [Solirubrobacteraceae bacterium]